MSVCCGCWRSPSLLRGSIARLALVIVRLMSYRRHNYKAASGSRGGGEPSVFVRWCFLSLAFLSSHLTAILISMRYLPRRIFGVWAKQSIHSFWSKETYLELLLLLLGSTLILDVKLFWERKGRILSAIPLYNLTTFVVIKPLHALPLKETCFNCCILFHQSIASTFSTWITIIHIHLQNYVQVQTNIWIRSSRLTLVWKSTNLNISNLKKPMMKAVLLHTIETLRRLDRLAYTLS